MALTPFSATWRNDVAKLLSGFTLGEAAYETGTWTPVLTFATPGDLAVTYTTQSGTHFRIGGLRIVLFEIQTATFTHTTASGSLRVTGAPDVSSSIGVMTEWEGITKANFTHLGVQIAASDIMTFLASGSGQNSSLVTAADMPTGGTVILRGLVIAAAG